MEIELSIVFGTYNRFDYLVPCVNSIRGATGNRLYEIIITDGGSTDGTLDYLYAQADIKVIEHGELLGPVKAYNDAFSMAKGKNVAHLNDDLTLEPFTLDAACKMLDDDAKIGQVAIAYTNPGNRKEIGYCTAGGGKKYLFASFGVTRRELGERAGWYDGYYHYNGDCHLSMSIWAMGYKVAILDCYLINHQLQDNAVRGERRWSVAGAREKMLQDGIRWQNSWGQWRGERKEWAITI